MVTKSRNAGAKNKGRVKVGKLKLEKETVKDLSKDEGKQIKGGQSAATQVKNTPNCMPVFIIRA